MPLATNRPPQFQVALCELTSNDDQASNLSQIFDRISSAIKNSVDLILFPETSLFFRIHSSQSSSGCSLKESFWAKIQNRLKGSGAALVIGAGVSEPQGVSNSLVFITENQEPKVVYRKLHLFDVRVEGTPPILESKDYVRGNDPVILNWKGWRLGLSICYDLRFSGLFELYREQNVDAILVPSAFLVPTGRAHWEVLLRARAIECQAYVLAPAQGGVHLGLNGGQRKTYGHSMAIGPWGEVIEEVQTEDLAKPRTLYVQLDIEKLAKVRQQIPIADHVRKISEVSVCSL